MTWLVIIAVGAGSFVFRLGPLLVFERVTLSERGDRVIRYAGTAALTALIVTSTKRSAESGSVMATLSALSVGVVLAARGASMRRLLLFGGATYACVCVVLRVVG